MTNEAKAAALTSLKQTMMALTESDIKDWAVTSFETKDYTSFVSETVDFMVGDYTFMIYARKPIVKEGEDVANTDTDI
jgi:hypothetical protein